MYHKGGKWVNASPVIVKEDYKLLHGTSVLAAYTYTAAKDVLTALHYYAPRQNALALKVGVLYRWKMAKCIASCLG